jgi:hypothetical protein
MPKIGESNTGTPGVIKINYPEKGQIGYLVKAERRHKKSMKLFTSGILKAIGRNASKLQRQKPNSFSLKIHCILGKRLQRLLLDATSQA